MVRATKSTPPPGATGAMIFTGLVGYAACAKLLLERPASNVGKAIAALEWAKNVRRFMGKLVKWRSYAS